MNPDHLQLREESRRMSAFAGIGFRSPGGGRHACIQGSRPVWQLIEVVRNYGQELRDGRAEDGGPLRLAGGAGSSSSGVSDTFMGTCSLFHFSFSTVHRT